LQPHTTFHSARRALSKTIFERKSDFGPGPSLKIWDSLRAGFSKLDAFTVVYNLMEESAWDL
jgi:hypothetical protein